MAKQTEDERLMAELMGDEDAPTSDLEAAIQADEPRLHSILTNEEVEEAKQKARDTIMAKRRLAAKKALIEAETARLEREEGLVTGDGPKDEMVTLHLDLAEHSDRIILSGTTYFHGSIYTVPRHVADTLRDIQARGHEHQNQVEGKDIANRFRRPQAIALGVKQPAVH